MDEKTRKETVRALLEAAEALEAKAVQANPLVMGKKHKIRPQSELHKAGIRMLEGTYDSGSKSSMFTTDTHMDQMEDAASSIVSIAKTIEKLARMLDDPRDARFDKLAEDLMGQVNVTLASLGGARGQYAQGQPRDHRFARGSAVVANLAAMQKMAKHIKRNEHTHALMVAAGLTKDTKTYKAIQALVTLEDYFGSLPPGGDQIRSVLAKRIKYQLDRTPALDDDTKADILGML